MPESAEILALAERGSIVAIAQGSRHAPDIRDMLGKRVAEAPPPSWLEPNETVELTAGALYAKGGGSFMSSNQAHVVVTNKRVVLIKSHGAYKRGEGTGMGFALGGVLGAAVASLVHAAAAGTPEIIHIVPRPSNVRARTMSSKVTFATGWSILCARYSDAKKLKTLLNGSP